ncbi:probable 39S ribosomal protein L24, mitochondrial [Cimex lectularius]|uniref:Large ribosomal subunit protein uL24m n=1 Tax=Cimex lectularius TaxID=79782 RepID=A0A8I6RCV1_CIMLE|nr:probable 39S ribosomal protein L24, mitochondrial [Cimex lectularius]
MRLNVLCMQRYKYGVSEITKRLGNFSDSYIKRTVEEVEWSTPKGYPQYLPKKIVYRKTHFKMDRPWTAGFQKDNEPGRRHPKVFLEPMGNWCFFKGDRVEILVGPDKGKQGTICQVFPERNWVTVEGLNTKLEVFGKTNTFPGSVITIEQPLLVKREVKLIDPSDLKVTDIQWRYTEEGEKVRVSPRTGRIIPIPVEAAETSDYKTKATYKESPKDTVTAELSKVTFSPTLKTFEMDIMDSMGIKEDREPIKTYWY